MMSSSEMTRMTFVGHLEMTVAACPDAAGSPGSTGHYLERSGTRIDGHGASMTGTSVQGRAGLAIGASPASTTEPPGSRVHQCDIFHVQRAGHLLADAEHADFHRTGAVAGWAEFVLHVLRVAFSIVRSATCASISPGGVAISIHAQGHG